MLCGCAVNLNIIFFVSFRTLKHQTLSSSMQNNVNLYIILWNIFFSRLGVWIKIEILKHLRVYLVLRPICTTAKYSIWQSICRFPCYLFNSWNWSSLLAVVFGGFSKAVHFIYLVISLVGWLDLCEWMNFGLFGQKIISFAHQKQMIKSTHAHKHAESENGKKEEAFEVRQIYSILYQLCDGVSHSNS